MCLDWYFSVQAEKENFSFLSPTQFSGSFEKERNKRALGDGNHALSVCGIFILKNS